MPAPQKGSQVSNKLSHLNEKAGWGRAPLLPGAPAVKMPQGGSQGQAEASCGGGQRLGCQGVDLLSSRGARELAPGRGFSGGRAAGV